MSEANRTTYAVFVKAPTLYAGADVDKVAVESITEAAVVTGWHFVGEATAHAPRAAMKLVLEAHNYNADSIVPEQGRCLAVPKSRMSHEDYELEAPKGREVKLG